MRRLNRVVPALPAGAFKTYQVVAPRSTHFRAGSCEEVECGAFSLGWRTVVDESTDLGAQQAHYIRAMSGRRFTQARTPEGLTAFTFAAGQTCFARHQVPLEREPFYYVKGGDFRGNPLGTRPYQHQRGSDWVEDFAEHQDRITQQIRKG